jgi:hypothetical protein
VLEDAGLEDVTVGVMSTPMRAASLDEWWGTGRSRGDVRQRRDLARARAAGRSRGGSASVGRPPIASKKSPASTI